jgi:hypothetical protein
MGWSTEPAGVFAETPACALELSAEADMLLVDDVLAALSACAGAVLLGWFCGIAWTFWSAGSAEAEAVALD